MTSAAPSSPGLEDLMLMSRGITIIPRSRSTSRASSRHTQRRNNLECDSGILKDFHISLTHAQFEELSEKYNIRSKERLSYLKFLQHFMLILKPQANTFRRKIYIPSTMSSGLLSKQSIDIRLCHSVQHYWRPMKQAFIYCDKERTGKISLQDFREVLREYNINLSEEDVFHFTCCFDKNLSGQIPYIEFLSILQK